MMNRDEKKAYQYYIPFSGLKTYDTFKDRKNGNLSNMKSQLQANQSTDKQRALKKKEVTELDQLEVGNIQSKLKKLIGAAKVPADPKSLEKKREAFNLTDSNKKDKKDKMGSRKKNMKLNISTESLGKGQANGLLIQNNDVENFLQSRFPATAPHKDLKDKKLFACARKDVKGTPKAGGKKLHDELAKKIQKSNMDLISTFKPMTASNVGRRVQTPTEAKPNITSAMLKALKKNMNDNVQIGSSKNKSFRTDKVADYIKNNFFVKHNFVTAKEKAESAGQKNSPKNRTTDAILKQLQKTNVTSFDVEPKASAKCLTDMISEEDAGNLNIEDLTFIEKKLNTIAHIMQSDFEIYDQIKEYVDIVQEESFSDFYDPLRSSQAKLAIKNSMILERWAMFFVFFFYFNQVKARQCLPLLRELVHLIHKNIFAYLKLFAHWISKFESLEPTYKSLNNLILKRTMESHHILDSKSGDEITNIRKNNTAIILIFKKTLSLVDTRIQEGLAGMCSSLDSLSIKDGLDKCLDSFCEFLIEKGVVSVEYTKDEGKKSKDTPQTTTTTGLKEEASGSQHTSASHPYGKPEEPFLPAPSKKYTLVMDLDETLVHYEDNGVMGQFYLRPYAQEFIDEMAKYYEVVIFTAALQDYADWIIDRLDSNKNIRHRLYRQHTSATNGNYHVKDISKLGRDLARTIIVDNIPENFQLQAENGIFIKSWFRDPEDLALYEMMPLLREIAQKSVPDVRVALKRFRDKMIENIRKGCLQPHLNLTLD